MIRHITDLIYIHR